LNIEAALAMAFLMFSFPTTGSPSCNIPKTKAEKKEKKSWNENIKKRTRRSRILKTTIPAPTKKKY
jgi:hypothetical protein